MFVSVRGSKKIITSLFLVSILSISSVSFANTPNSIEKVNSTPLKHSKDVKTFDSSFKKYAEKTLKKNKKFEALTKEEQAEWEVLYDDLITLLNIPQSKELSLFGKPNVAMAYDGSSFTALKNAIEASMDTTTLSASEAYASKAAADKANEDQTTYMINNGYTGSLDNTVDAFRHFSWNYHLVDTWYVTRGAAKILTDNHEFAEKGADYALANYPNSSDSIQTYNGAVEALSLKQLCWNTYGGLGEFKNLFGPSSLMDFNNNEAGRAYESKGYSNNFTAFAAAVTAGKVTTYPSQWSLTYLQNTTYAIYSGTLTY